jgi:hypothetical protein
VRKSGRGMAGRAFVGSIGDIGSNISVRKWGQSLHIDIWIQFYLVGVTETGSSGVCRGALPRDGPGGIVRR